MSTNSRNFLNIPSSISPVSSLQTMCMIIKQAQRASKKEEGEQPSADKEARSFPTAPRRCPSAMESVDLRNKHKRPCSDDQLVHPSALNPPYLSTTTSRPFRDQTHAPRVVPFVILRLKTGPTVMSLVPATRQVMLQGAFQLFLAASPLCGTFKLDSNCGTGIEGNWGWWFFRGTCDER